MSTPSILSSPAPPTPLPPPVPSVAPTPPGYGPPAFRAPGAGAASAYPPGYGYPGYGYPAYGYPGYGYPGCGDPAYGAPQPYGYPPTYPALAWFAPVKPRVWTVFVTFVLAFGGHLAAGIAFTIFVLLNHGPGAVASAEQLEALLNEALKVPHVFVPLMFATVLVTLFAGVVPAWLSPVPVARRLRVVSARARWWQVVAMVVGAMACGVLLGSLLGLLDPSPGHGGTIDALNEAFERLTGGWLVAGIAVVGLLGPLAEELLFRGYIQTRLRQRWGPVAAVLVASVLFGVLHFDPLHTPTAMLIGLFLGYVTERCGSIVPAILGHMANNTMSVLGSAIAGVGTGEGAAPAEALVSVCVALVVLVACVVVIRARNRYDLPQG